MKVAVVGRGLWGTAAALHLARDGAEVILIGPDEPDDPGHHDGPFASHHDAGRITRILAHDPLWSRLSAASVARYPALQADTGIEFFTRAGGVMAAPEGSAFARAFLTTAETEAIPHDRLTGAALRDRFPHFAFAPGTVAARDRAGGHIDPRAMRRAFETLATRHGARVIREPVSALTATGVALAGQQIATDHVLVATGAYAALSRLLPRPAQMQVFARTVLFAEMNRATAARYTGLPSLIFQPQVDGHDLYLVPPIRYPDGTWRLKIGGEADSPILKTEAEARQWFHGSGSPQAAAMLKDHLRALMPELRADRFSAAPCMVAFTASGYPMIGRLSDRLTLAAGGNGAGAKCADEVGRLAARAVSGDTPAREFRPVLA